VLTGCALYSVYPSQSTRFLADRYITVTIFSDSRKRRFSVGIRAGVGDCELFCGRADGDRVLRFGMYCYEQLAGSEAE